jgi:hypothetical protein
MFAEKFHSGNLWIGLHVKVLNFELFYASPKEKVKRYEVFKQNLIHIAETNRKNGSYWLGLNRFAGMSHEEFKGNHLGLKQGQGFKN